MGTTIGNGQKIHALGRGNICIQSFDSRNWISAELSGVLYIPMLHRDLFSPFQVVDNGCEVYAEHNKRDVTKGGGTVAVGARNGKLSHVRFKVKQPERRKFAIVAVGSDVLFEAIERIATGMNVASYSTVSKDIQGDVMNKGDDVTLHSTMHTSASEFYERMSEESTVEASNNDVNKCDDSTCTGAIKIEASKSDDIFGESSGVINRQLNAL